MEQVYPHSMQIHLLITVPHGNYKYTYIFAIRQVCILAVAYAKENTHKGRFLALCACFRADQYIIAVGNGLASLRASICPYLWNVAPLRCR